MTQVIDDTVYVFWFSSANGETYGISSYDRSSVVFLRSTYLTADEVINGYDIS